MPFWAINRKVSYQAMAIKRWLSCFIYTASRRQSGNRTQETNPGDLMGNFRNLILISVFAMLTACATSVKMQPSADQPEVADVNSRVTLLLTATLKNAHHPSYQPKALVVMTEKTDASGKVVDSINFPVDDIGAKVTDDQTEYQFRLVMDPQPHTIRLIFAQSGIFPVRGSFFVPLHLNVNQSKPGVYYGGHIDATIRERQDGEFRAGPVIPLLDQGVVGASGGTFEIKVSDRFESDMASLKANLPGLQKVEVKKALLPAWDRAVAQKWWEDH